MKEISAEIQRLEIRNQDKRLEKVEYWGFCEELDIDLKSNDILPCYSALKEAIKSKCSKHACVTIKTHLYTDKFEINA